MSDRYLFRGKRTDTGEWVFGSYIHKWHDLARINSVIIQNENSEENGLLDDPLVRYYIDPKTVGQGTGLKDKNGTLIFEGDIIDDRLVGVGEVTFNRYAFKTSFKNNIGKWFFDYLESEIKAIKIIGNIHEEAANE